MTYAPFDLSGTTALVTGGNRGIGLGMALGLAQAGADIAVWGRDAGRNAEACEELAATGVRAVSRVVDVSVEAEVVAGVAATVEELGRVDTVVANAGYGPPPTPFVDADTETWRRVLGVNLDGVFWTLREAGRHMVDRAKGGDPGGSLVVVSSLATVEGAARNQAYAATKGGVVAMVRGTAVELARHGVRVNAVLPGWIATEMTAAAQQDPAVAARVLPRVPVRRWGTPADFGGLAVYLASSASAYHTGDTLVVDGGYRVF